MNYEDEIKDEERYLSMLGDPDMACAWYNVLFSSKVDYDVEDHTLLYKRIHKSHPDNILGDYTLKNNDNDFRIRMIQYRCGIIKTQMDRSTLYFSAFTGSVIGSGGINGIMDEVGMNVIDSLLNTLEYDVKTTYCVLRTVIDFCMDKEEFSKFNLFTSTINWSMYMKCLFNANIPGEICLNIYKHTKALFKIYESYFEYDPIPLLFKGGIKNETV